MNCFLVTPNEELLFDKAMTQTRTLRFHKLSKLLKQRTRELMAKFSGFFRKSNEETLTMKMVDNFIEGLNTATSRPNTWTCYPTISCTCNPCKKVIYDDDDECIEEYYDYDPDCECKACCEYKENHNLEYIESDYSVMISEPIPEQLQLATRRRRGKISTIKSIYPMPYTQKWYETDAWKSIMHW